MKSSQSAGSVFVIVTISALIGMVLGGVFGYVVGGIAPDLFMSAVQTDATQPRDVAVVSGAFGGLLCGGGLGVFGVIVQCCGACLGGRN